MRTNLKVILSAASVIALLASPAMAKTVRHHVSPSVVYVPNDARGAVGGYGIRGYGPYTPNIPSPPHGYSGDFQDGSRG